MTEAKTNNPDNTDKATPESRERRPIRSFTLRQGRMTNGQKEAIQQLWPLYGLGPDQALDAEAVFGRNGPVILEIGFGNGESLAGTALARPDHDFVGIEVHSPGVGHLLMRIRDEKIGNLRIYNTDAIDVLKRNVRDHSLSGIQVFFPDPWPKFRHHKRRLVNPEFLRLAASKLQSGGYLHLATDWENYALQMLGDGSECPDFVNQSETDGFVSRPSSRPETKFEKRGVRLGHKVYDLYYLRK